ncbi:hypothetical protein A9Q81_06130 [Gammaproteobacteria bacterium 42_54_T18]|nr:hypothetical protein A9Q81_06130 [Gammaproteobacteria bacterium 42_54_T18]
MRNQQLKLKSGLPLIQQVFDAGFEVDSCCGNGFCGMCRVTLTGGAVKYKEEPLAALLPNEIVLCQAIPTTEDIVINI